MPRMESGPLLRCLSVSMAPYSIAIMACFYGQTPLLLIHVQSSGAERTSCRSMLTNLDSVTLVLNCYRMPSAGLPLRRRLPNKSVPLRSQDRSRSVSPGPASWTRSGCRPCLKSQSPTSIATPSSSLPACAESQSAGPFENRLAGRVARIVVKTLRQRQSSSYIDLYHSVCS